MKIEVRTLSCFCGPCITGNDTCENNDIYCKPWMERQMLRRGEERTRGMCRIDDAAQRGAQRGRRGGVAQRGRRRGCAQRGGVAQGDHVRVVETGNNRGAQRGRRGGVAQRGRRRGCAQRGGVSQGDGERFAETGAKREQQGMVAQTVSKRARRGRVGRARGGKSARRNLNFDSSDSSSDEMEYVQDSSDEQMDESQSDKSEGDGLSSPDEMEESPSQMSPIIEPLQPCEKPVDEPQDDVVPYDPHGDVLPDDPPDVLPDR